MLIASDKWLRQKRPDEALWQSKFPDPPARPGPCWSPGHSRLTLNFKEHPMFAFKKRRPKSRHLTARLRPRLEALEGRVVLSTLKVNTFLDTVAVNPTVSPKDSSGHISLRSAIQFADANPRSSDTIVLQSGTYTLTIPPTGDDGPQDGDLDILVDNKLTIKGSTKGGQTIINGNNLDRVFLTLSGKVSMSNLVIEHGSVHGQGIAQGGGLWNDGATDTLTSVQFLDDFAVGQNGAAGAVGTTDGGVGTGGQPGSAGGLAEGGAICNFGDGSSLTLTKCSLAGNEAIGGDGGPGGAGGAGSGGTFDKVGLAGDGGAGGAGGAAGAGEGGGIFNGSNATLILSGDTFSKNEAFGGSGGIGGAGGNGRGGAGGNGTTGSGSGGNGGSAEGGPGGAGGRGGLAAGGGIYNGGGQITLVGSTTSFTSNEAGGGSGGPGGPGGNGNGGSGGFGFGGGAKGGSEGDAGTGGGAGARAPWAATAKAVPSSTPRMARSPALRQSWSPRIPLVALWVASGATAGMPLAARAGTVGTAPTFGVAPKGRADRAERVLLPSAATAALRDLVALEKAVGSSIPPGLPSLSPEARIPQTHPRVPSQGTTPWGDPAATAEPVEAPPVATVAMAAPAYLPLPPPVAMRDRPRRARAAPVEAAASRREEASTTTVQLPSTASPSISRTTRLSVDRRATAALAGLMLSVGLPAAA